MMLLTALLLLSAPPAWAREPSGAALGQQAAVVLGTARSTTLDLWRPYPDADKVLVPATLPDGREVLFLLDTGAATSVLTPEIAHELELDPTVDAGYLSGLGGTVPWSRTLLPKLQLGEFELHGVDVAIGVPGVPDRLGPLPIAGILGTNVWSNFVVVVDYPTDTLELHLAGAYKVGGRKRPLIVREGGAATPVTLHATGPDGKSATATVLLEVDTGAHDLLLVGGSGEPFREVSTVGEEAILGIGANLDELPDRSLLRPTRRFRVTRVDAGGDRLAVDVQASWLGADRSDGATPSIPGLLGYTVLKDRRVVLDFPGGTFKVGRSRGPEREFDAMGAWLVLDEKQHGPDPTRALDRASILWSKGNREEAFAMLSAAAKALPDDAELLTTLAGAQRLRGEYEASVTTLSHFTPAQLADEGAWVAHIGTLILLGRVDDALAACRAALDEAPAEDILPEHREQYLVALSDALVAAGRLTEASAAVDDANAASPRGGSAHLLRKARIAEAAGDRYGAMVALRELIDIVPIRGQPIWWYSLLVEPADVETFRAVVNSAVGRLHPGDAPYDFLGAAWHVIGDEAAAKEALDAGRARDCVPLPAGADRDNCNAWYLALDARDPDRAQAYIDAALAAEPDNAAYLDTGAVVALAAGRTEDAVRFARQAAMLSPDDPYLLWQLTRMEARARASAAPSP